MGYGFTLPENEADTYTISLPFPASPQKVFAQRHLNTPDSPPLQMTTSHLRGLVISCGQDSSTFYLGSDERSAEPLIGMLSLMVANERELKNLQATSLDQIVLCKRAQLQAKSQLKKALNVRYEKIARFNMDLLKIPMNRRQLHVSRYRDGQRNILHTHMSQISLNLSHAAQVMRVITLSCILTSAPTRVRREIRRMLRNALGTRDPVKLKQRNYQDVVFALFIGVVWMTCAHVTQGDGTDSDLFATDSSSTSSSQPQTLHDGLRSWILFLGSTYCPPPCGDDREQASPCQSVNCFCASDSRLGEEKQKPWTIPLSEEEKLQDERNADTAYLIIRRASLLGEGDSIVEDKRWTKDFLLWTLGIWRAEAVTMPTKILKQSGSSTEEKEDEPGLEYEEESVLFLDVGDETNDEAGWDIPPRKKQKLRQEISLTA